MGMFKMFGLELPLFFGSGSASFCIDRSGGRPFTFYLSGGLPLHFSLRWDTGCACCLIRCGFAQFLSFANRFADNVSMELCYSGHPEQARGPALWQRGQVHHGGLF
jgi:hypothetical protein